MKTEIETEFALGEEVYFIRQVVVDVPHGKAFHYVGVGVVAGVTVSLLDRQLLGQDFPCDEGYVVKAAGKILRLPRAALRHQATQAVAESMAANEWMFEPEAKP